MRLRTDSWIARLYFWHLRHNGHRGIVWEERETGSDLCRVIRRVFVYLPFQIALYVVAGVGAVAFIVLIHSEAGWVACLGFYGGVAIVAIGFVGGHYTTAWLLPPKAPRRHGSFEAIGEWVRAVKHRYCPRVEFTNE